MKYKELVPLAINLALKMLGARKYSYKQNLCIDHSSDIGKDI
jgi:hypothetical protein